MRGDFSDISGNIYGKLFVECFDHTEYKNGRRIDFYRCKCTCGNIRIVPRRTLITGATYQCKRCKESWHIKGHDMTTKLYGSWKSMKSRCDNKNNCSYPSYGGRGITYCDEWSEFKPFETWARTHNYVEGKSLERIDVNGNYTPDNCTWIDLSKQARNRRDTIYVEFEGKIYRLRDLYDELNLDISYQSFYQRFIKGKTVYKRVK